MKKGYWSAMGEDHEGDTNDWGHYEPGDVFIDDTGNRIQVVAVFSVESEVCYELKCDDINNGEPWIVPVNWCMDFKKVGTK